MLVGQKSVRHVSLRRRLWFAMAVAALYGFVVHYIELQVLHEDFKVDSVQSVLGLVFGGLLVFRTNSAYARWWEGRTLWGTLVNNSRNLIEKVCCLAQVPLVEREDVTRLLIGFAYALRNHLRRDGRLQDVPGFENDQANPTHVPNYIVALLYQRLGQWRRENLIIDQELRIMDVNANALLDVCGGCERIARTPMVVSYVHYLRVCIVLYLLALPWTMDATLMMPMVTMLWAYFLCGMELIAEIIEEPFGRERDDLPLDDICSGIHAALLEILSWSQVGERPASGQSGVGTADAICVF